MTEVGLVQRVAEAARQHGLLRPGEAVLVAVSGGADSAALALVLREVSRYDLPLRLVLGHVDHGWRSPAEAARDREAVEALAARASAPLAVTGPPPEGSRRTEDAARRFRYPALERMATAHGCRKVATAHHLRDQAETVLMRLLRGSGPAGLAGIPRQRALGEQGVEVVRPFLGEDPRELRAWLQARGVVWREDATNLDVLRERARLRARLLAVEARGGSASRDLARLAQRLRRRLEREQGRVAERLVGHVVAHPLADAVEVDRALLATLSPAALDLALRDLGTRIRAERDGPWFTRRHVARVRTLLETGGALDLPRGLAFAASGRRAWLRRRAPEPLRLALRVTRRAAADFDLSPFLEGAGPLEAVVDADRLGPRPRLRPLAPGDRFRPYGEPRAVDVRSWLTKRQVPAWLRARTWVVEGGEGIAWVVGHRVDAGHAIVDATDTVAVVEAAPAPSTEGTGAA